MPIGEIFPDVRLILPVAVFFFALAALYSSEGHGGCIGISGRHGVVLGAHGTDVADRPDPELPRCDVARI